MQDKFRSGTFSLIEKREESSGRLGDVTDDDDDDDDEDH